ncbi:MAG: type IV secretory system conjugative DNA transfer family protein, partial [Clostridiales bacterium]|nr:type IV secretory system conjugative DNA transfer family protein [Clostridiales bacterium]
NYRRREEHGSAKWGEAGSVNRRYRAKIDEDNKILTQNVRIGFDGHIHKRNLNVLVVGGAGAGKTRYYAMPNILQANKDTKFSMVVLDPKMTTFLILNARNRFQVGFSRLFYLHRKEAKSP